jgi:hypothetical protein
VKPWYGLGSQRFGDPVFHRSSDQFPILLEKAGHEGGRVPPLGYRIGKGDSIGQDPSSPTSFHFHMWVDQDRHQIPWDFQFDGPEGVPIWHQHQPAKEGGRHVIGMGIPRSHSFARQSALEQNPLG